jgi:hypothetical protein
MSSTVSHVGGLGREAFAPRLRYDVVVDHATLRMVDMDSRSAGYAVRLVGPIDDAWIRCFRSVQADARPLARFVLDPRAWSISFLRRSDDGPADVIAALQALDDFIRRVNRYAGATP